MRDQNVNPQARVGLSLTIVKDNKILLGERAGSHGAGEFATPGGHFDYGEKSFVGALLRELDEEVGSEFKVKNIRLISITNILGYWPKQYVDLAFAADWESGEPKCMEPEKCKGWGWYDMDNLPQPLFVTIENHVKALKSGGVSIFDAQ